MIHPNLSNVFQIKFMFNDESDSPKVWFEDKFQPGKTNSKASLKIGGWKMNFLFGILHFQMTC